MVSPAAVDGFSQRMVAPFSGNPEAPGATEAASKILSNIICSRVTKVGFQTPEGRQPSLVRDHNVRILNLSFSAWNRRQNQLRSRTSEATEERTPARRRLKSIVAVARVGAGLS